MPSEDSALERAMAAGHRAAFTLVGERLGVEDKQPGVWVSVARFIQCHRHRVPKHDFFVARVLSRKSLVVWHIERTREGTFRRHKNAIVERE